MSWFTSRHERAVHLFCAVVWSVMLPVSVLSDLRSSVPYLVGISVYALLTGHLAAFQGADAAVKAEKSK